MHLLSLWPFTRPGENVLYSIWREEKNKTQRFCDIKNKVRTHNIQKEHFWKMRTKINWQKETSVKLQSTYGCSQKYLLKHRRTLRIKSEGWMNNQQDEGSESLKGSHEEQIKGKKWCRYKIKGSKWEKLPLKKTSAQWAKDSWLSKEWDGEEKYKTITIMGEDTAGKNAEDGSGLAFHEEEPRAHRTEATRAE